MTGRPKRYGAATRRAPNKRPPAKIAAAEAGVARTRKMWLILVDDEPLAHSIAYTRAKCKDRFVAQYKRPWAMAVAAGYSITRANIIYSP